MTDYSLNGYQNPSTGAGQAVANYHVWLLRVWREHPDEPWRIALQCTDGKRIGFPELKELFAYLQDVTQEVGSRE
jgi:hypothetical protein